MATSLHLVSHHLCPYVQRAVIVAVEKGIALERTMIDLAHKPDWFVRLSPTGKVPLLRVTDEASVEHVLFESAAICEFLDETSPGALLPAGPWLVPARGPGWSSRRARWATSPGSTPRPTRRPSRPSARRSGAALPNWRRR